MSYLATLVGTPAAAAASVAGPASASALASAPGIEMPLEQHLEIESAVLAPSVHAPSAVPATPPAAGRASLAADDTPPSASAQEARQSAIARAAPRHEADASLPATPTAPAMPARAGTAALDIRAPAVVVPTEIGPTEIERVVELLSAPPLAPVQRSGQSSAARTLPLPAQRIDLAPVSSDSAAPARRESHPARELGPSRQGLYAAARQRPFHDGPAAAAQATAQTASIQVRIGSIALHVRTPPAPTPPVQAAPVAAPLAAAEPPRAPSPAFAFSAQRHHLRWY